MAGRKPQFTIDEMVAAVQRSKGLATVAARQLGCGLDTVLNYRKRYQQVADAFQLEREKLGDLAESRLFQGINNGEAWAIIFYLKTQMKHRGYVERYDIRVQIQEAAAQVAQEFSMTPEEVLAEAESFLRESAHAR